MNPLDSILTSAAALTPDAVRIVAWTLLHFLWQGALVAAALAVALTALRRQGAQLRYAVALGALLTMTALPLATGTILAYRLDSTTAQDHGRTALLTDGLPSLPPIAASQIAVTAPAHSAASSPAVDPVTFLEPALPAFVALWMAGVAVLAFLHWGGWTRVWQLRRQGVQRAADRWQAACDRLARQLGVQRSVELLESALVQVPTVLGWLKPVILVPASTLSGLSPRQLESILAHELAHIRRHDYAVNALQVAVETLLFYHPAMWWASRQVRTLREHCCDDLAVEICDDRMIYARALADLEDLRFAAPVFALGADGGPLLQRIRRLVGGGDEVRAPGWVAGSLAATALAASATIFTLAGQPGLAQEADGEELEPVRVGSPLAVPPVIVAELPEEPPAPPQPRRAPSPPAAPAPPIPIDELIEMKIHGVDDLLDEVAGTAYADLPMPQLIELAKFGVDAELIAELDAAGFPDLPAEEIVEMAKFGIDGDYIQEMKNTGYELESTNDLVEMAKFGVDAELIVELSAAGFSGLPAEEIVEMAKFGIDGDYIQEIKSAGYDAESTADLVELAKFGVDAELVTELASAGYKNLSSEEIVDLAKFGVDGDFIRELREAGITDLSISDLTRMARHGIDAEFITQMSQKRRGDR